MSDLKRKHEDLAGRPVAEAWKPSDATTAHQRRYQAALRAATWRPVQVRDRESGESFAAEYVHVPSEAYGASGVGSDILRASGRIVADASPRNFADRFEIVGGAPQAKQAALSAPAPAPRARVKQAPQVDEDEVRRVMLTMGVSELAAREALEGSK